MNKNIISNNLLVKFLSLSIAFTVIFSIAAINQKGFKNRFIEFYKIPMVFTVFSKIMLRSPVVENFENHPGRYTTGFQWQCCVPT